MLIRQRHLSLMVAIVLAGVGSTSTQAGTVEYLSDSLADRIDWVTQGWGELGFNTSVKPANKPAEKLRIQDKEFTHGLGHHAPGEIVVDLGGQFRTFETEIGIQWQGGRNVGSVVFQIYVDGKRVFDSGVVRENDPPRPVEVAVEGANELRLVAGDAGNGIECDCADWAEARLTRNPAALNRPAEQALDIAPFGQVATWDPDDMSGTRANRVEEMPVEDIVTYTEVLPSPNGAYLVPVKSRTGCIGLRWDENRRLRRVELQFSTEAAVPPVESVRLQYWVGESAWQGTWQTIEGLPERMGNRLAWPMDFRRMARGTQKVRWVFTHVGPSPIIKSLSAFTRSRWSSVDLLVEPARPDPSRKVEIEIYNGVFENPSPYRCTWDGSKSLALKVRASTAQRHKADRTVLRFQMPDTRFGVAIEDVRAQGCVYVPHANVFVTLAAAPVTPEDYLRKIAAEKPVLAQVRQQPDQEFPRAWAAVHNPVQDLGPMMLSLANDNRKFIALREGGVLFDLFDRPDDPRAAFPGTIYDLAFKLAWRLAPRFGSGRNLKITRHLEGDWLPIPVTTATDGAIVYQQTTWVVPVGASPTNAPSWLRDRELCVAHYLATNSGSTAAAELVLNFAHESGKVLQLQEVPGGLLAVHGDRVVALIDARQISPLTVKRTAQGAVISGTLPGGASAQCSVCLPAWRIAPADYALLADGAGTKQRVEDYWTRLLEPAMQIGIPDPLLSCIIRASQVHCLLAARCQDRGAQIAAWASADRYGPLESESCSIIRGMGMIGHEEFARRSLEFFLQRRSPAGFITTGYTLVGTGEILWTLAEHFERTRDREWMRRVAPDVVQMCHWTAGQREKTRRQDARGQQVPEFGLMPPGVTADWNRFAYRFFNDAQYCAGLELAAQALAKVGNPEASTIALEARRYREDILRAYHWTQARMPVVRLGDGTWVPDAPALLDCFGRVEDFLPAEDSDRTWCYNIEAGAHHLVANEVIEPAAKEADWLIHDLEDTQFLRSGWGDYPGDKSRTDVFNLGGFSKLQPYYTRIAEAHALRDDVKPFIRSYFNAIPSLVSRENLSFWEHFHNMGGWNKTHETGWFLCQTRTMFVTERGDELWLAPFVPCYWLQDGMNVTVRNAPTRFGPVGYAIRSALSRGQIEATIQLPQEATAKRLVLRLRHPEGKPMRAVTVQGQPHTGFDLRRETITLEAAGPTLTVRAEY